MILRTLYSILLILLMQCCSAKKEQPIRSSQFLFSPSFMPSSSLEIKGNVVSFKVSSFWTDTIKTVYDKTFELDSAELRLIESGFEQFNREYESKERLPGNDGITVQVISELLSGNDTLRFWSPRRNAQSEYYLLLDPIFNIMRAYLEDQSEINYIEHLEQYFDFDFPIKRVSNNPLKYRIYGALSVDDETTKKLDDFIDSVPVDEPVIIDMSNFQSMGTLFYPNFKRLLKRNHNIKWLANEGTYEQLIDIGVKGAAIEKVKSKRLGEK
jgi:hypothetical protein